MTEHDLPMLHDARRPAGGLCTVSTTATPALSTSLVIYARDVAAVSGFYRATLGLNTLEQAAGFVLVGNAAVEISVVHIPEALAAAEPVASPPRLREETPLKASFLVDDLEAVHAAAAAAGGATKPPAEAWHWRGQRHLDGHDPEGNVVQFRAADATA